MNNTCHWMKRQTVKGRYCSSHRNKIWIYWSKSYPWINFYIVLKKITGPNNVLLVLNRRIGAHHEDWFRVSCLPFFDLRLLITLLISSNLSCKTKLHRTLPYFVLFLLAIELSVLLSYTNSDYLRGIFKLFLISFLI